MRHFLTLKDVSQDEIKTILSTARGLKREFERGIREPRLAGLVMGLMFSKPSLRTRVSFEAGMSHLGGTSLYLGQDVGWGTRESVADFARVVSQYLDVLVCRTHAHESIVELSQYCECPVINGLTDLAHPCQALADMMTLQEISRSLTTAKLAFVGDGNNVSRSLAIACCRLNVPFIIASPSAYHLDEPFLDQLRQENPQWECQQTEDPVQAVRGAAVVYTDVWSSMGFEKEADQRRQDFAAYQVNAKLMSQAPSSAVFMHCLPAHRGEEVTSDVIDSPQSVVVRQAANRMHLQKGLLVWLLSKHE